MISMPNIYYNHTETIDYEGIFPKFSTLKRSIAMITFTIENYDSGWRLKALEKGARVITT